MRGARRLAAAFAALVVLAGCASGTAAAPTTAPTTAATTATSDPTLVRVASLKGPTTMGLVHLMDQARAGEEGVHTTVSMYAAADQVLPLMVRGEADVALLPANVAAVLTNRLAESGGGQVQVAAITTLGMLEVLEAGTDTVHSIGDLKSRTLYSTGKGASPQYVLEFLLREAGLDPATDVTVEYRSEPTEVAALLAANPGALGVLPQPFATSLQVQNPQVRTALQLADEWTKVAPDSAMVTAVLVVRTAFADEHPQAFAAFLDQVRESTRFTNEHPDEAGELVASLGILPSAAVAAKAIPACRITFVDGQDMKTQLSGYLQVLYDADPASVGGSLPGDDFYRVG